MRKEEVLPRCCRRARHIKTLLGNLSLGIYHSVIGVWCLIFFLHASSVDEIDIPMKALPYNIYPFADILLYNNTIFARVLHIMNSSRTYLYYVYMRTLINELCQDWETRALTKPFKNNKLLVFFSGISYNIYYILLLQHFPLPCY